MLTKARGVVIPLKHNYGTSGQPILLQAMR